MTLPALSLFTGYGGLDMAVSSLMDIDLVAVSDIDAGPRAVLTRYHPAVPNLGDIKAVNWSNLPDYRVLTGGYPCQPFSAAGRRKGADDPRHLWPHVLEAIKARRPDHVFLENVRGHLSLGFATVLEDLAAAGYEASWSILAAASAGAPHRRERLYIYAAPGAGAYPVALPAKLPPAGRLGPAGLSPAARVDENDPRRLGELLPTPLARDHKGAYYGSKRDGGASLADVHRLFPAPADSHDWGVFAEAVARWTLVTGNVPPCPVKLNRNGNPQLTPEFPEWLMGLPAGYLTAPELGLSRAATMKLAGNGVVPQAASHAFAHLTAAHHAYARTVTTCPA